MNKQITKIKKESNYRVEPQKLTLWLLIVASVMLFAAFTSAFLVSKPDAINKNTWTVFDLPITFLFSLITVIISSGTIFWAYRAAKRDEITQVKVFSALTLLMGGLFCAFQFLGYQDLVSRGLFFVNPNPEDISVSFVYVITAAHVLHVFGGMVLLAVLLVRSFQYKVHKKSLTFAYVAHTYWHFVGLLWIYLYLFLYFAGK